MAKQRTEKTGSIIASTMCCWTGGWEVPLQNKHRSQAFVKIYCFSSNASHCGEDERRGESRIVKFYASYYS
jgi:hypothetical protein